MTQNISRRTLAKGAAIATPLAIASSAPAWAAPSVRSSTGVPEYAASSNILTLCQLDGSCGPFYIDQRGVGSHSFLRQGNFHFLLPVRSTIPEMNWVVEIIPVENDKGKIIKDKRDLKIEDLASDDGGSAIPTDFPRTNVSDVQYDPSTGVEKITFTTPEFADKHSAKKGTISVGFKVFTGAKGFFPNDLRADRVRIRGYQDGNLVVDYDTIDRASPDKRRGASGWDPNQDGRV
ncbi:hypothetical protein ACN083_06450 [Rothia sp. CCM 9418]|uniref:hypothetical protein n=1 Tax=Rothia sp. CCM 9418 TaxID=3402661 RepID=UPI003AE33BC1